MKQNLASMAARLNWGRKAVIGVPYVWLGIFFLLPFFIVFKISLSEVDGVRFVDLLTYTEGVVKFTFTLVNYLSMAGDDLYIKAYGSSIFYALVTTVLCLFIGYPFAYFMARARPTLRPALLMLVMLPFWTSFLLRIYAWKGLLDINGVFNQLLLWAGLISDPVHMLHTPFSLTIGMVYAYVPFMILPLYANLVKMDVRLLEASADLGARPLTTFWKVTVPLSRSGIIAGSMLVLIPCVGEYVIPELLGGPSILMIARVLWDEFFSNNDWPRASTVAVLMIVLILVPLAILNKVQANQSRSGVDG